MSKYNCKGSSCYPEKLRKYDFILNIDLSKALELDLDQMVDIIYELTGENVEEEDAKDVIKGLYMYDISHLLKYPLIMAYVIKNWAPGKVKDGLIDNASLKTFKIFKTYYNLTETEIYRFIDAGLFMGKVRLIEELFKMGFTQYLVNALFDLYPDYSYENKEILKLYKIYAPSEIKKYNL